MDELENMSEEQLLEEVKKAMVTILVGGQSYKIGSRELTRADLGQLRALKTELEAEIGAGRNDNLLDGTVVAVFDRR